MKRSLFKLSLQLLLIIGFPLVCISQKLDWNVNLSKPVTFTSVNPVDDPGVSVSQMWHVSMKDLMNLPTDPATDLYGIFAKLNDQVKGFVKVAVYLYDQEPPPPDPENPLTGRGPLIFQCFMDKRDRPGFAADNPNEYDLGSWLAWWPDAKRKEGGFYFNDYWKSNDSRSAVLAAAFYNYNHKYNPWNAAGTPGTAVIPNSSPEDLELPVVIEVTIYKANVDQIRLPGIGDIEAGYFRSPYLDIKAATTSIFTNSAHLNVTISAPKSNDKVTFSDVHINLSPFGNMTSPPLASKTISVSQIPYSNKDLQLFIGSDPVPGEFWIWASYDITIEDRNQVIHRYPNRQQFLANYTVSSGNVQFPYVYTVTKHDYQGLPVFTLNGGMSAEYGVEKSVASLSSGISETWDARMLDGKPDIKGGGPVSIYPDPNKYDFLDRSVKQTVKIYNDNLGATTPINTVILGTGIAHVPYLANAMKAPFLPLHFLVSVHSVAEIQRILDTAITDGYSPFSMIGYDPSIPDIGVAWIKLRELPPAYKQFLIDHKVQNVIIMGYQEKVAGGEGGAKRVWIEGQPDDEFAEGSMYMMGHGEERTYKDFYKDYYRWNFGEEKLLVDWEGGVADIQFQNISAALKTEGITAYAIRSGDSFDFYQWGLDIQLKTLQKNNQTPQKISLNEYLIGYPEYELYTNTVPYLYWQGGNPGQIAFNIYNYTEFKLSPVYPLPFKDIPVYIQAKYDRSGILDELKENYFTNVTMDSWQKADVWDPSDGMNAPCELIAVALTKDPNGVKNFTDWNNKRAVFDFNDFTAMAQSSVKPPPVSDPTVFPKPANTELIDKISEAGLTITKYCYDPNAYWQPPNFPNNIEMRSMATGYPGQVLGYLDGQQRPRDIRKQQITISQYDLGNASDEYDLRMGYKFNITDKDGLLSYDPAKGTEQNMDCFEFTSIPYNAWYDIPSRMMAKSGAVWIVNGGVYDFDYNGLPGVVPFIKKNGTIKAQPQILSFKGEAAFGWNWGKNKSAAIVSRPKDVPGTGIPPYMSTLFQDQTKNFLNVMGAMTFMSGKTGSGLYDIKTLQPDWMIKYPAFPPYYLTADRCFFAPVTLKCAGTEIVAPIDEGWNDCSKLQNDDNVQRFSALAYQQYSRTFDDIPNARTFIALKGKSLEIGIIDGDYGKSGYSGRIATKTLGMHVYEESQFCLARGYDQFVNLDGGSSTQMWLNGRGPLQMMNSYILKDDNQGPYYSRLLSSFIMLVPKLHTEFIRQLPSIIIPNQIPAFDNRAINFYYDDKTDLTKNKAFIDLSVCKDSLNKVDGSYGMIAGNFTCAGNTDKNGGILFYAGEDMFYPETKGIYTVTPRLRNLMVVGVGLVLPSLIDTLKKLPIAGYIDPRFFRLHVTDQNMSAYYIKVYNGEVVEFLFSVDGQSKYLTGDHRFYIRADGQSSTVPGQNIFFDIDGHDLFNGKNSYHYLPAFKTGFLNIGVITHAHIGAVNLDGRFLTGDINLKAYNYLFAVGKEAWSSIFSNTQDIDNSLSKFTLPGLGGKFFQKGIFALQCMEVAGYHVFALAPSGSNRFYGLRLNNTLITAK